MKQICFPREIIKALSVIIFSCGPFLSAAQVLEFSWESGSNLNPGSTVFGTPGVPNASNNPGRRDAPTTWTDESGNFWMFGGGPIVAGHYWDDLWKYDGAQWTWVSGNSSTYTRGVYGTKGVSDPSNKPGARGEGEITWIDASGNLWLFGGNGYDDGTTPYPAYLNDLWKFDGTTWTWVSGSKVAEGHGVYGTKGVASATNLPGGRSLSVSWTDGAGTLWLFGGAGKDDGTTAFTAHLNDVWKYDGTNWTWVGGSSVADGAGVYGVKGVADPANIPGARYSSASWQDASGNLWLLGGWGYDVNGADGLLNDLWKFDGINWTWISGSNTRDIGDGSKGGVYGTKGVGAAANTPGGRTNAVSWLDGSGDLWLFGGNGYDEEDLWPSEPLNDLWKFDGTNWIWISGSSNPGEFGDYTIYGTQGIASPTNVPGSRVRSATWIDGSNNLWLYGGAAIDGSNADLWKFDGTNWTWMSGGNTSTTVGTYGTKGVADAANVPGSRMDAIGETDLSGNLWLFGGAGIDGTLIDAGVAPYGIFNDLWKYDGTNWTWVNGSNTVNNHGVYGAKGIPDPSNIPGARGNSVSWTDVSGNFWVFGGSGLAATGDGGGLNDLWKFDGTNWTWVSGAATVSSSGIYGTQGIAAPGNSPGARVFAAGWRDESGNLWLFGGEGYDESNSQGSMNDLWKFDGTNWTWVSGSKTRNSSGVFGTMGIADPANVPTARRGSLSWIDGSGNMWLFGGANRFGDAFNDLWKFDGMNWSWIGGSNTTSINAGVYGVQGIASPSNAPGARQFSAGWSDASDDMWLFGGSGRDEEGRLGYLSDVWKFDGTNWTWMGGSKLANVEGDYGTKGIPTATNLPGGRSEAVSWVDGAGDAWIFGGYGYDKTHTVEERLNDLWRIRVVTTPEAPTALVATNVEAGGFTAHWSAVAGAASYELDVSVDDFATLLVGYDALSVSATEQVVVGLMAGAVYRYRVRAVNSAGLSANSNVVEVQTLPDAPVALPASEVAQLGFYANWSEVYGATSYQLDVSADDFATFVLGYDARIVSATTDVVTGLDPEAAYKYRVRAVNASGTSANSNIILVATLPMPPPVTVALDATEVQITSFIANWDELAEADGYELDVSADNFSSFLPGYDAKVVTTNEEQVTGLIGGTEYSYRVRAVNTGGESGNSNVITVTTLLAAPLAPSAMQASNITSNGFTANWNTVADADSYELDVSADSFATLLAGYDAKVVTTNEEQVTGLTGATEYSYRVRAVNTGGESDNSDVITVTTPPAVPFAPGAMPASNITPTSFIANWNTVADADSYELDVSADSFATLLAEYDAKIIDATFDAVTGLAPSTQYKYRVRAVNGNGLSPNSNVITVTTTAKGNQVISFDLIPTKTMGDAGFALVATASSELPVTFSTTSDKISINGFQVTLVKAGRASVVASQPGNSEFNAAPDVDQSFCIRPASPAITATELNSETITLTSSSPEGNQWYKDSAEIGGATGATLAVTAAGIYKVQALVDDCVSEFSDDYPVIVTGDIAALTSYTLRISPNPTSDFVKIDLPTGAQRIAILQSSGRIVLRTSANGAGVVLDVREYAAGYYLVRVETDSQVYFGKFIRE